MEVSMTEVMVLQHIRCETLGLIEEELINSVIKPRIVRIFDGEPVPKDIEGYGGLIVMGGPMGVYEQERYPFLVDEMRLMECAMNKKKPVLGVCLGSQLLAAVLGARVYSGSRVEIGWYEVLLTEAARSDRIWSHACMEHGDRLTPLHWHGDLFDLPSRSKILASSDMTPCQAFVYDSKSYGILFHMEVTEKAVAEMTSVFDQELRINKLKGKKICSESPKYLPSLHRIGCSVFGRWVKLLE